MLNERQRRVVAEDMERRVFMTRCPECGGLGSLVYPGARGKSTAAKREQCWRCRGTGLIGGGKVDGP